MDGTLKETDRSSLMTLRLVIWNYKEFLLSPGTIFTFVSGVLLLTAILIQPASLG